MSNLISSENQLFKTCLGSGDNVRLLNAGKERKELFEFTSFSSSTTFILHVYYVTAAVKKLFTTLGLDVYLQLIGALSLRMPLANINISI